MSVSDNVTAVQDDLRAAFEEAAGYGEEGIQVAAFLGTDLIVDAAWGAADRSGRPVTPDTLFPVFRDEEELSANADLSATICRALERSENLIVICSPRAVAAP